MSPEVAQLIEAIAAVDSCDLAGASDHDLHDAAITLQQAHSRLGVVAGRVLAAWERRGTWADDQSRTSKARLARELNCSARTAAVTLRRAHRLRDVSATVVAVEAGTLSTDHIDLLAAARTTSPERFAADEPMLVQQCSTLRYPQAERLVAYWRLRAAAASPRPEIVERTVDGSALYASETLSGTVVLHGTMDAIGGQVFVTELRRLERAERLADERRGLTRTIAQRRAAALVEMATRSAATPKGAKRPRPLFSVLLGDERFSQLCEMSAGRVLPPAELTPHLSSADLEVVLFDGPATVVSVSRRRSFTGAVRRAIEVHDRHCQHPSGCDVPADECDVDHIVPYIDGGRTDQFNGRLECATHNRHADRHDIGAEPLTVREVTVLDEIRARLRWQFLHGERSLSDDDPDEPAA